MENKETDPGRSRHRKNLPVQTVYSTALHGIDGQIVTVESSCAPSPEHRLEIIGLPDTAVKESAARVRSAARNLDVSLLPGKLTVNLAPADIRKEGTVYDLPILLSLIDGKEYAGKDLSDAVFVGELSLSGDLRPISGALPMAIAAAKSGFRRFFCPVQNAAEASAAPGITVYPLQSVSELFSYINDEKSILPLAFPGSEFLHRAYENAPDFSEIKGQETAKKALEVAAAGMHNTLLIGPPGSGKSMLASRLPYILPPLTFEESLETSQIYSVAGLTDQLSPLLSRRPFRAPHHTISSAALVGGGTHVQPGEISFAHNGVLFLDEFPEFEQKALETMRQPLEDRSVTISRVSGTATFPCSFMLICAMNPCPCGYYGHPSRPCTCSPKARQAYLAKISGPMLDRIDIQVEVGALDFSDLDTAVAAESSEQIRARVKKARSFALARFDGQLLRNGSPLTANAFMEPQQVETFCVLDADARELLRQAFDRLGLSARGYTRLLKVARTVADFEESEVINRLHVATAIRLRSLDHKYFGTA